MKLLNTILSFTINIKGLVRRLLQLLIVTINIGFIGGIIKILMNLRELFHSPLEIVLRQVIIDTLILLALLEVLRTVYSYISDGRVKVTFIVDTVLIVMINEIMSVWFKGEHIDHIYPLLIVIFALILIRVISIRFSPEND